MKVTVFGSGYVGLVTGACLSEVGNKVMCVDVDPAKIERLGGAMPPAVPPNRLRRPAPDPCGERAASAVVRGARLPA